MGALQRAARPTGPRGLRQADMTVTRPASAGARRTWLWPAAGPRRHRRSPGHRGSASALGRQTRGRATAAAFAVAALAAAGITGRAALAASFAVLGHLHWIWIPAAIVLEAASMAAFAIMLRRLLAAGGASVGVRPMLATAYAANAVSVSVPLAGPGLATAFTFRRFTGQGADAPLAGWSLLAGGVVSSAAAALVVARRRAGVREHPGRSSRRSRRRARRGPSPPGRRGHAPAAATRHARTARRMDAAARVPAAAPARRRPGSGHPGLGRAAGLIPASRRRAG